MPGYVHGATIPHAVHRVMHRLRAQRDMLAAQADALRTERDALREALRPEVYVPGPTVDYSPEACAARLAAINAEAEMLWSDPRHRTREAA